MDKDELIEMLKDRLEECCDCIEASYGIIRESGRITNDAEMTVEGARYFIEQAKSHLEDQEKKPCNTPQ
ncbi:hypothetical protein OAP63_14390 [Vibrio sp.]|nr:hypothetical protein [Vibrio sp.]